MTTAPHRASAFPYTLSYLQQLLEADEQTLLGCAHALGIQPQTDEITGSLMFTQQDVDHIRRLLRAQQSGMPNPTMPDAPAVGLLNSPENGPEGLLTRQVRSPAMPAALTKSGDNLGAVIEAVNQVKENILKDLSQLLDDKLSGLDEVVVELIRAKADNDALKQRLSQTAQENQALKQELASFRPFQFGFYRKAL